MELAAARNAAKGRPSPARRALRATGGWWVIHQPRLRSLVACGRQPATGITLAPKMHCQSGTDFMKAGGVTNRTWVAEN